MIIASRREKSILKMYAPFPGTSPVPATIDATAGTVSQETAAAVAASAIHSGILAAAAAELVELHQELREEIQVSSYIS